jgi:hypothetical protein
MNSIYIYIFFIVANALLTIFFRFINRPKLLLINFTLIIIFFYSNVSNPDYDSYRIIFDNNDLSIDIGFRFLINISKFIGLNYHFFRTIVYLFSLTLIILAIKRILPIRYLFSFFVFYPVYPMILDFVQIRNFLMFSLFIYGFTFLNKNPLKFFLFSFFSLSVHISALLYLPVVFFIYIKGSSYFISLKRPIIYSFIFILFFSLYLFRSELIIYFFDDRNIYLTARFGFIFFTLVQFFFVFILKRFLLRKTIYSPIRTNLTNFHLLIDYSLILTPLYILNLTFFRYFRNLLIINLVDITYQNHKLNRLLLVPSVIAFLLFLSLSYLDLYFQLLNNSYICKIELNNI